MDDDLTAQKVGAGDTVPPAARAPLFASLRVRLLLLVALALVPAFALVAWNHYRHLLDQQTEAQAAAQRIAHSRAKEFGEKIEDMRGLLGIVAGLPTVREDPRLPVCSERLADMRRHLPHIGNLGVTLPDGTAACSALGFDRARPPSYADRLWFRRAAESGTFAVGEYVFGRLTNSHMLVASLPVKDAQGRMTAMAFAGMDLGWLSRFVADLPLQPGAALLVLDSSGRILARHPEHDAWVGKLHPQAATLLATVTTAKDSRVEHSGVDGILRAGALARVPGTDLTVYYGLPKAVAEAEAREDFIANIAFMLAILLASFALTWLVAETLVLRRARRLSEAAARISAGDLSARSGIAAPDEIGQLGTAFDRMAEAVAERERHLERANRALRVLSGSNRALLGALSEQELFDAVCQIVVDPGGYRLARIVIDGHETVAGDAAATSPVAPLALPLHLNGGGAAGRFEIHSDLGGIFDENEVALLTEMADDLAFGVRTLRLRESKAAAENAAREHAERLRFALETCQIGAWDLDMTDHTTFRSREYDRIFGYPELLPQWTLDDFFRHALPEYHEPIKAMVEEAKERQTVWNYECRIRRIDGEIRWIWFAGRHFTDSAGRHRVAGVVQDITERKQAEEEIRALNASLERRVAERTAELARANEELARSSRLKSDFLASMSHELRTPLNAIIGFSEVLHDGLAGEVSAQQREYLHDILSSGTHLLSLINDILDLSKVEAGKMELELECLSVESTLHTALSIVREKATAHRLALELDVAPDVGELCADARKVKQIVYNLLSNAVKFTPDGGRVRLAARRVARDAAPTTAMPPAGTEEFVEIAVTDTGIGIAPEDQARLFSPFTQIDSSLSRQYEGTGLGLALVSRLAELHGGAVGLESEPEQGATFRVWLPCRPVFECVALRRRATNDAAPSGTRALVVEDDANAFELLRLALEDEGFTVARAVTAAEARRQLEAEAPDLITLDIILPGEDGWQFLDWLKRNAAWAHIPVVVTSIVAEEKKGFALGASAVLQKPFMKEDLVRILAGLGFARTADSGKPARVLVVDDDPLAVERLATLLVAEGHVVERAGGGREGVAKALAAPPDLILLDLMMPEVSGFDVVKRLRTDSRTLATPIVIVTAKLLDEADRRALNGHVEAVVQKSEFSPAAFIAEVRRALGSRRSA